MRISTRISHTYIGDLEVWLGWKDDSEGVYREGKIWDRQGGSEDHLNIDVYVNEWYDVRDWRLRVKDNAAGDEGAIMEFYVFIG
jgi:subtilisin-like proprotein convertase family protein